MKKQLLYIVLLVIIPSLQAAARPDTIHHNRTWIMGIPQYLFQNGVKVEIDKMIAHGRFLTFSPVIYHRGQEPNWISSRYGFESMNGAGLEIFYRYYTEAGQHDGGFYLLAGGGYEYFSFKTSGYKWDIIERDGIDYYEYNDKDYYYSALNAINLKMAMGYKILLERQFAVDVYLGPRMSYSFVDKPQSTFFYASRAGNYGYARHGIGFYAGIRIGMGW
jgi:hypothetical protein